MTVETATMPPAYRSRIEALVSAQADPPEHAIPRDALTPERAS